MKPAIQKQVNQVKIWLSEGKTTGKIINLFAENYGELRYSKKTIENRIRQAKESTPPLIQKETDKIDTEILEREKKAQELIKQAHIDLVEFLAGAVQDVVKIAKEKKRLSYLSALKTAKSSGFDLEKVMPAIRLENGLPNSINNNNNNNNNLNTDKDKQAEIEAMNNLAKAIKNKK
jgi:hypothetical protein